MHADEDTRVLAILESFFLAEDEGSEPDLEGLCGGDTRLVQRVERLLASEHAAVRTALRRQEPHEEDFPRRRLGEFRIIRRIGRGGMGTVFLAEQESLSRLVALKVLDPLALEDSSARIRFRREAEVAAAIEHPNIVPVFGIGEEDGYAFIAMKLLTGPCLDELGDPRSPRTSARIGMEIARALDAAHLHGVVHRDVKPANILLDGEVPTIVDFGLARSQTDRRLTRTGAVPGTLPYMAPEQLSGESRELDPRIDVYALGATLYELISGHSPFDPGDAERLVRDILVKDPPPLRVARADRDVETIIQRALEKEPDRRFPTAAAMGEDLQRYLEGKPILSRRSGILSRSWKLARRHRRASAIVASLIAVVLVLGGLLAISRVREQRRLGGDLARAGAALEDRAFVRAIEILEPLEVQFANDARVAASLGEARAAWSVEQLLDAVILRRIAVDERLLARRVAAVSEHAGQEREPRLANLALALAAYHQRDPQRARQALSEARSAGSSGSSLAALEAVVSDAESWPTLPEPRSSTADDHVLVAVAMRIAERPLREQEEELDRARELDPFNERVLLTRAIALEADGRYREAAVALDGLERGVETPPAVWRVMAFVALERGRLDEVEPALRNVPEDEETTGDMYLRLQLAFERCRAGGGWEPLEELLEHYEAYSDTPEWKRASAQYLGFHAGDADHALELLESVAESEADVPHRDLARADALRVVAVPLGTPARGSVSEQDREVHRAVVTRAEELLSELEHRPARGIVYWMKGRSHWALGDDLEALEALRRGIPLAPGFTGPTLLFARILQDVVPAVDVGSMSAQDLLAVKHQSAAAEAIHYLMAVSDQIDAGELRPGRGIEYQTHALLNLLASRVHDAVAYSRSVDGLKAAAADEAERLRIDATYGGYAEWLWARPPR